MADVAGARGRWVVFAVHAELDGTSEAAGAVRVPDHGGDLTGLGKLLEVAKVFDNDLAGGAA